MVVPHTSSAELSRGSRQPVVVGVAVLLIVAGIALGALLDRALWATAQAEKPPAVVQCPACPACPSCPTTSCPPALPAAVCGPCAPATPCPSSTSVAPCPPCADGSRGSATPLGGTLWVFEGAGWRGAIDFTTDGRYLTHWGWGRYTTSGNTLSMRNDYDGFTFSMTLDRSGMQGTRSDGAACTGRFLSRYSP